MRMYKHQNGTVHIQSLSNSEYTLCGDAFDGDLDCRETTSLDMVKNEKVTCKKCLMEIEQVNQYLLLLQLGKLKE